MAAQDLRDEEERQLEAEEARERRLLREQLEQGAQRLRARRLAAEEPDLGDEALPLRLQALGFNDKTAALLPYLPLIQVAWADGSITRTERIRVFEALRTAQVGPGGEAWQMAEALLEERPSEVFLEESRRLLHALLQRRGAAVVPGGVRAIVELCVAVAQASGGLFGVWWRTSPAEEQAVAEVAKALGEEAVAQFQRRLRSM